MNAWHATVLTLFPDMFPGPLGTSLAGKGLQNRIWTLETVDIRDFASDKHRTVDDTPFGGGPGLVMRPDVLARAIDAARERGVSGRPVIYLTPRGARFDQARARALAGGPGVLLICGRFEGIDQRVIEARDVEEISLGDFVLAGGEIAAMAVLDAAVRLLPGIVGDPETLKEESFADGPWRWLLEYPQFTRPAEFEGQVVPEVLTSGHHERIKAWRLAQAEALTKARRTDLWSAYLASGNREAKKVMS